MSSWYQLAQLVLTALVSLLIAERVRALHVRLACSDEALRWLLRELGQGRREPPLAWARARPETQAARLIAAAERIDEDETDQDDLGQSAAELELTMRELLLDLRDEAGTRLSALRVAATVASTLGLLGGILTLTGVLQADPGLLALQAGAVQRESMTQAIATMAIGVGTSALCFQALSLLRPAATKLITQAQQLAGALR